jgi:hypothetical protein
MKKPRRKFQQHMRSKMMQELRAKNFEKGFNMLFSHKPSRRKQKINKILQEQREVLKKERIFLSNHALQH